MKTDHIYAWKLWKQLVGGAAEDTVGAYGPDDKTAALKDDMIGVGGARGVAVRVFGKAADNKTATMTIVGWNKNGPGQVLCSGQIILGSVVFNEKILDNREIAAGNWYEVDTYDFSGGSNACDAQVFSGGNQALLLVPTLGYTDIDIRFTDKDGSTGTEAATICAIWRPIDVAITSLASS